MIRHVLHVLTETYDSGGHTRLARRWIDLDGERRHSVFVTGRIGVMTGWLREAAVVTGGTAAGCSPGQTELERARALRAAAATADVVVLHVHPFDPVPMLALAEPTGRPPVVMVNHADHAFWLGVGVADVLAEITAAGTRLSRSRRGVDPARSCPLPIPLPEASGPSIDRAAARATLGVEGDRPVLMTAATAYKYRSVLEPDFTELAVGVLRRHPDALLLAAGPAHDGVWARAADRVGGRIRALGHVRELEVVIAAADVYLDSWPCSSGTSLLEAALGGLPVVSFVPDREAQGPLTPTFASLDGGLLACADRAEYEHVVGELLRDRPAAVARGAGLSRRVRMAHAGQAWHDALEHVLDTVARIDPARPPQALATWPPAPWQAVLEALHQANGTALTPAAAAAAEHRRAPARPLDRRVFAAPPMRADAVEATVEAFAAFRAHEEPGACIVVLAPSDVEIGVRLLERALAVVGDVDIDVLTRADGFDLIRPGDLFVAAADSPTARAASARGATIRAIVEPPRPRDRAVQAA